MKTLFFWKKLKKVLGRGKTKMGKAGAMGKWEVLIYFGKREVVRWILGNLVVYWPKWIFGRRYLGG